MFERSALSSKMKAWDPNGKLCGWMDVQNLCVLERYILDGMSQIHGALASTTTCELSQCTHQIKSSPHKEGQYPTPMIKKSAPPWASVPLTSHITQTTVGTVGTVGILSESCRTVG
eukprot:4247179-Prymnesium_polylepis.1